MRSGPDVRGPRQSMTASTPCPPVNERAQSATDLPSSCGRVSIRSGARAVTRARRLRSRAGDAAAERVQRGAETERAGEAVDEDGLAGSCARFAQRRISGADIAETRCAL